MNALEPKNHYVSAWPVFKTLFRGTASECAEFSKQRVRQWKELGRDMQFAVFYDTGTAPETIYTKENSL